MSKNERRRREEKKRKKKGGLEDIVHLYRRYDQSGASELDSSISHLDMAGLLQVTFVKSQNKTK